MINLIKLHLLKLAICLCLASMPALARSDAAEFAYTPRAKRFQHEFATATALGKHCKHREESISQYYAKEFARLIRLEANRPLADNEVDREVGMALVLAAMFAKQSINERKLTQDECAVARKVIDETVPRGYDKP